jgi:hypothetical protein
MERPPRRQGPERAATVATTDEKTTWVAGTTWRAGEPIQPFVVSSGDRSRWTAVELPDDALESAVEPGAAVPLDGGILVVGKDGDDRPVAVQTGDDDALVVLPAAPDSREFHGFTGVAAHGSTVVATALVAAPGETDESVVYRSTDGGKSWTVAMGPASGPSYPYGIAVQADSFVVTGLAFGADSVAVPGAWSSTDGATWNAVALPALGTDADGLHPDPGEHVWLGAPASDGDQLVAPVQVVTSLRFAVLQREPAGTWTVLGKASNWELPSAEALTGFSADGSLVIAQSMRNAGRVGTMDAGGAWVDSLAGFGTIDPGLRVGTFMDDGSPVLVGSHTVTETRADGGWSQTNQLTGYTVADGAVADRPWDPAESGSLMSTDIAQDPQGATVLAGSRLATGDDGAQLSNAAAWFRPAAGAAWTPAGGLASGTSDDVAEVTFAGGTWVAVGASRASFGWNDLEQAAVWTSADGLTWARAQGPFASAVAGGESWATGACAFPKGDLLVVGKATEGAQNKPLAWRRVAGVWQQVDTAALGASFGELTSCTTTDGVTLVQGSSGGRDTVWRTTDDGATFAATTVGARGDQVGPIRAIDGGYAAAGTRGSDGQRGAVVWLSTDGTHWRSVPVPSDRQLTGADVTVDGSKLLVAANSTSAPEVWVLGNPEDLFQAD